MTLIKKDLELIKYVVKNVLDESFKDPKNPLRKDMHTLRKDMHTLRKDVYKIRDELKTELRKIGRKVNILERIHPNGRHQASL